MTNVAIMILQSLVNPCYHDSNVACSGLPHLPHIDLQTILRGGLGQISHSLSLKEEQGDTDKSDVDVKQEREYLKHIQLHFAYQSTSRCLEHFPFYWHSMIFC